MFSSRFRITSIVFALLSVVYLVGLFVLPEPVQIYLKCALLPVLIVGVLLEGDFEHKLLLLGALVFSWIGDAVLAFAARGEMYFLGGVAAFAIAQIFYFFTFRNATRLHAQNRGYPINGYTAVVVYVILLLLILIPYLRSAMTAPIIGYALLIGLMMISAIRGWAHWDMQYGNWIVAGAVSFVASDTLLAFNKFHTPFPFSGLFIMATYLFAQWAIVFGLVPTLKKL